MIIYIDNILEIASSSAKGGLLAMTVQCLLARTQRHYFLSASGKMKEKVL